MTLVVAQPYLLSTQHPQPLRLSLESTAHANAVTESTPNLPDAPLSGASGKFVPYDGIVLRAIEPGGDRLVAPVAAMDAR